MAFAHRVRVDYGQRCVPDAGTAVLGYRGLHNNPITLAVLGFRKAFWGAGTAADYPDDLLLRIVIAGVIGLLLLIVSHRVFTRLQGNFAQEM